MQNSMASITEPQSMVDVHRLVVQAAISAPSAENTQPWCFRSEGDQLIVYRDRRRSLASDMNSMLDYTGLGAAIENGVIAARQRGFEPSVSKIAPSKSSLESEPLVRIAELDFQEGGQADPLFPLIESRCTSRRMNNNRTIPADVLARLAGSVEQFPTVRVDWVTDTLQIRQIARLVGLGNRIRFEHRPFHAEFYENIRWTPDEAEQTRDGLDVATLQLPWGVAGILSSLRYWGRISIANGLGFSRSVARQAAREVCCSGALGLLSVGQPQPDQFLDGGRALERIWLSATAEHLGLHPTAGLPVFLTYAQLPDLDRILPRHGTLVKAMNKQFNDLQPDLRGRTLQMVFRLGYADQPPVRSLRRFVADVLDLI